LLKLTDFKEDQPWADEVVPFKDVAGADTINGVRLQRLVTHGDSRGDLTVLLSTGYGVFDPLPPHVYQVTAGAGSIRAWVFHRLQSDRLAFTTGRFRVVLFDLREESATHGKLNVLDLGSDNRVLLTIPPFVVHGVQNRGADAATFVNLPTNAYDPAHPDKARLPWDHAGIPYRFE
jgi:dTDP-4-dehydrorhamnose 3,5-epimerase